MNMSSLPVVIIGAGPVGLAAALHVIERGLTPVVLEAGSSVGEGVLQWSHVRMFSPWEFNIDKIAGERLRARGWMAPKLSAYPTGHELVTQYLEPVARLPELATRIELGARVVGLAKQARDRMKDNGRMHAPFVVRYVVEDEEREILAQAVIDASGTMGTPNPMGASGIPALGERAAQSRVAYGMPDVLGSARSRYAGKRTLVVGSGHSAFNVLADLARLAVEAPGTVIQWAIRRPSLRRVLGGGSNDQLRERGLLGIRVAELVSAGVVHAHTGVHIEQVETLPTGLVVSSGGQRLPEVDEIVVAAGFRPDLSFLDEIRLDLDPGTQSPSALAPLIDPNMHSCGSVRPHGAQELKHPETGFYIVGMKSYGRAPTFLAATGYEQVRSVAAALAGDWEAARRVELVLPETGVCSTSFQDGEDTTDCEASCATTASAPPAIAAACCGGPAPKEANACCVADADAKATGEAGCGCPETVPSSSAAAACCR